MTQFFPELLVLVDVYSGCTFCHSLLGTVGIRVPSRNLRDFLLFTFGSSLKNSLSADVHQLQIQRCAKMLTQVVL
jgi:hypothetical protein